MGRGSSGGSGFGSRSRGGGGQKPRISINRGMKKEYEQMENFKNGFFWDAATDRTDVKGKSEAGAKAKWNGAYDNLTKALGHVEKHGNDFEKSVAATIKKGLRKYDEKAFKVGYVSSKQAFVIGKALAETHFNGAWMLRK